MKKNSKNLETVKGLIPLDVRMEFITKLQSYLDDEFETEIGEFEAEEIFSFFCERLGPAFYNCGIEDARRFLERRFVEATEDISTLNMLEG